MVLQLRENFEEISPKHAYLKSKKLLRIQSLAGKTFCHEFTQRNRTTVTE
jgi:hypothetical protein